MTDDAHPPALPEELDRRSVIAEWEGSPRERILELRDSARLSERDIALATGADVRTIRRWRRDARNGRRSEHGRWSRYDDALDELLAVVHILQKESLPPEAIRAWLRVPNEGLDHARPLELLDNPAEERLRVRRAASEYVAAVRRFRAQHSAGGHSESFDPAELAAALSGPE